MSNNNDKNNNQPKNLETDTHFYFYTNEFSNFHICIFTDLLTGIKFNSSEAAYMWQKANHFKDSASMIKLTENPNILPKDAKAIGRSVANYNDEEWNRVKFLWMIYVNFLKYSQNIELQQKLLQTNNKILVESSKADLVWGVGLYAADPLILDEKNWRGKNLLGKALMQVRDILKTSDYQENKN
jgi:ribA/ribD-fused uncharacterized protein